MKHHLFLNVIMYFFLSCLMLPTSLFAEATVPNQEPVHLLGKNSMTITPANTFSLFDANKFSMQHSYLFSFNTDGKKSTSQNLYLNTLNYRIAEPLLLKLRWGLSAGPSYFNSPSFSNNQNLTGHLVLPEFELHYQPSKNFHLSVEYRSFSESAHPPYRSLPF